MAEKKKVISSEKIKINFLIITNTEFSWIPQLNDLISYVQVVEDPDKAEALLTDNKDFNVILYYDASFDQPTVEVINQIQVLAPKAILAIISDDMPLDYYNELIEAGATETIATTLDADATLQRIMSLIRQSKKNSELAFRTRKLHAINLLSQKLHNAEHPTLMIVETVELICNYFDMYGVAITIDKGDHLHLYAGTSDINNLRRLYESTSIMEEGDPLRQVIQSNISLIFKDIKKHPNFVPIPVIHEPKSAIIVPIRHGATTIGSLAFFANENANKYTSADVAIFELLANNFAIAYYNVNHHHWREIDAQSMRFVLKVWPKLNSVYTKQNVVQTIHDHILEIDKVKTLGIWLFSQSANDDIIYSGLPQLKTSLETLHEADKLKEILNDFEMSLQPATFHARMAQTEALVELYNVVGSSQITLVPIAGNSFEGIMFVTFHTADNNIQTEISLVENLARVTANVLERNTLIESIEEERIKLQQQTGRVEGVLRSIDEGIFFVNDQYDVVYCNPQFSELTHISPSQVMNKPCLKLFQLLVVDLPDRKQIYDQLVQASELVQSNEAEGAYPIVEIQHSSGSILLEFMRVDTESEQGGWIGVIGTKDKSLAHQTQEKNAILQNIIEDISLPLMEINQSVGMLPEQFDILNSQNFEVVLSRLEQQVQSVQSMWSNFVQIYRGETSGIKIHPTTVEPVEFIETLLTANRMYVYRRQIRFEANIANARIMIDERQMRQCFINLVEFMSYISNRGAPIFVNITSQGNQLIFKLQEKTTIRSEEELSSIFSLKREETLNENIFPKQLGMYLAKQIVNAHGGQLSLVSNRGIGLVIKLQLPLATDADAVVQITEEEQEPIAPYKQPTKGLTITVLESQSRFLASSYTEIRANKHELIVERNLDDVLFNLKMTKVDIVFLEVDNSNTGLVGQVQLIRAQSEVPILISALPEFEDECLQALAHGADDYLTVPFNEDKLLAQLYAISKRREIAARTAEPIEAGDLKIDFSRRRVYLKDELIDLTTKEYDLLRVLAMNRGEVMSHKKLLAKVWGPEYDNETQYLWVNISRLRRKLEPNKDSVRYIQNEPRVGYMFNVE